MKRFKKNLKRWAKEEVKAQVTESVKIMKAKVEANDILNTIAICINSTRNNYELRYAIKALELASSLINQLCQSSLDYVVKGDEPNDNPEEITEDKI